MRSWNKIKFLEWSYGYYFCSSREGASNQCIAHFHTDDGEVEQNGDFGTRNAFHLEDI